MRMTYILRSCLFTIPFRLVLVDPPEFLNSNDIKYKYKCKLIWIGFLVLHKMTTIKHSRLVQLNASPTQRT